MVTCFFRDADVVITSWTDAPLSWPHYRALDANGGGSRLLIEEDLLPTTRLCSKSRGKKPVVWACAPSKTVYGPACTPSPATGQGPAGGTPGNRPPQGLTETPRGAAKAL
jgi:hypothetical protein